MLANLGPLKTDGNGYSTYYYSFWTSAYSVPAGKRLVIEQIFFEARANTNAGKPTARLKIATTDTTTNYESESLLPFELTNHSSTSETIYSTSQLMKVYVTNPPSGKTVKVSITLDPQYYTYEFYGHGAYVSGYLENVP